MSDFLRLLTLQQSLVSTGTLCCVRCGYFEMKEPWTLHVVAEYTSSAPRREAPLSSKSVNWSTSPEVKGVDEKN